MFQKMKRHCKGQAGRCSVVRLRDPKSSEWGVGGGESRAYSVTFSRGLCALLVCVNFIYRDVTDVF